MKEIPVIHGLKKLWCSYCTGLTQIHNVTSLEVLDCSQCPLLTEIPIIHKLTELYCSFCPLLTEIPTSTGFPRLKKLSCSGCPWLSQNPHNEISHGLKLQKWIKNNFKFFVFQHWINSQEGKEFLYHPEHIGGRIEKSKMKKVLSEIL